MKTPDDIAGTVRSHARPGSNESGAIVAFSVRGRDGGAQAEVEESSNAPAQRTSGGGSSHTFVAHPVAFSENQRHELRETTTAMTLPASGGGKPGQGYPAVRDGMQVRRLTPTERERLMGWPDGWTFPYGPSLADAPQTYPTGDRAPVDLLPDGPRESACGDGVVEPVARWLGERLIAHAEAHDVA